MYQTIKKFFNKAVSFFRSNPQVVVEVGQAVAAVAKDRKPTPKVVKETAEVIEAVKKAGRPRKQKK
jgi:hypothetical protein